MKNRTNKILAVALAITLLALAVVAGTLAYLTKTTQSITNVFTKGADIFVGLYENDVIAANDERPFTYTAGGVSDPKAITVKASEGSADSYVFIKVELGEDFNTYCEYTVNNSAWTVVEGAGTNTIVYAYAEAADDPTALTANTATISLLTGDAITYKNVDTAAMDAWITEQDVADSEGALTDEDITDVSFKVTAYAIQTTLPDSIETIQAIWGAF